MHINTSAFVDNLYYMGTGMLGILIVMGAIIGVTLLLMRICGRGE